MACPSAIPALTPKASPLSGMTVPMFQVRKVTWGAPEESFRRTKGEPFPAVTASFSVEDSMVKFTNQSLHPVTFRDEKEASFQPEAVEPR